MKPVAFDLRQPGTVDEAVELLTGDGEVKVLAGGQSLVPLLNFRLARPELLVDINRISELQYVREEAGGLAVGALTRQRALERSEPVARLAPLVAEALPLVAHVPIRNRGTLGGSLAHADAAAELCAVALALDAVLVAVSRRGRREIPAAEFFLGPFTTALEPDELLIEVRFPRLPASTGWAFEEVARRKGDFAMVGVAVVLGVGADGSVVQARLAYASMGPTPLRAGRAEAALTGRTAGPEAFAEAAELAISELEPTDDIHADREYRLHVARVLTRRALARALERAR
ncbi:MAG TPA: xanthine dehydrogenase family protein subunit M [Candidatus Dormibacteraeota bacterium]|nr:xanthine dehydrogenase family protein subunit M [Candidatus Dormibacteraeota bacterium]